MSIDIANTIGIHTSVPQRVDHTAGGALPTGGRLGHMMGIAADPIARQFGIDPGTAGLGML